MQPDLLVAVPANTNVQESRHHTNLTRSPPGQLLQVISRHEMMDMQAMKEFYARGSGGSEKSRPLNDEKRYARQAQRSLNAHSKANIRTKTAATTSSLDEYESTRMEPADDRTASIVEPETQSVEADLPEEMHFTPTADTQPEQGGGGARPRSSHGARTTPTPGPRTPPASPAPPPAKRARKSVAARGASAAAARSSRASAAEARSADVSRLVAVVERQVAMTERQMRVTAQQQELLRALLEQKLPVETTAAKTTQSHAGSSPHRQDPTDGPTPDC
ncbi:hypothetical protein MMPV_005425 [Pyropia vietnamensis]